MRTLKTFRDAFNGIGILIRSERNFQIHLAAFVLAIGAGFYFNIQLKEFGTLLLVSALVFSLEAINTAIEKLCDEVSEERKESIRVIKDVSAGAVLIAAIFSIIIGIIIFLPYLT
ncbi:MAG: diacylglycerol kinase family protein [Crocinitomicaceae bacterium]|nr:diacylglycerol kinase family protein [Flavobacteriales bacterium]NQZ35835.1 diacylglycerol kinase family protein [Crocinitomicaceae bacterium]